MIAIPPDDAQAVRPKREAERPRVVAVYAQPTSWEKHNAMRQGMPAAYRTHGFTARTFKRDVRVDGRKISFTFLVVREAL